MVSVGPTSILIEDFLKRKRTQKQSYHSYSFTGNHCHVLLKVSDSVKCYQFCYDIDLLEQFLRILILFCCLGKEYTGVSWLAIENGGNLMP